MNYKSRYSDLNYWIRDGILRNIYYNVKFPDMKCTHGRAINKSVRVICANSAALFPIKSRLVWKPPRIRTVYMQITQICVYGCELYPARHETGIWVSFENQIREI